MGLKIIRIKYVKEGMEKIGQIDKGDWIDLRVAEDIHFEGNDFKLIPLGVAMALPPNYEALVIPRSSTFKKYGIIQANSIGLIDETYCGDNDEWKFPAYATRAVDIPEYVNSEYSNISRQLHLLKQNIYQIQTEVVLVQQEKNNE